MDQPGAQRQRVLEAIEILELQSCLLSLGEHDCHVTEVFGPGRFTSRCSAFNLKPGSAFDLRNGQDFDLLADRKKALDILETEKPALVIGSPKCAPWSSMQNLVPNSPEKEARVKQGLRHMTFMADIYRRQVEAGRMFLHEQPKTATSWNLTVIKRIAALPCAHMDPHVDLT